MDFEEADSFSNRCTSFRVNPVRMAILETVCFFPWIPNSAFAMST